MTTVQGSYTDFSEYPQYNPEELFIYNNPRNRVITAPQRTASKYYETKTMSLMPDTIFTGHNPIKDTDTTVLSSLNKKSWLYDAIISKCGYFSPIETRSGMFTNTVPSNGRFSTMIKDSDLTLFVSEEMMKDHYKGKEDLRDHIVKRRISPSEFGYKREQTISGGRIILKQKDNKLYIAFSPCYDRGAASSCGGFDDYIEDKMKWYAINRFIVASNGYIYVYS